MLRVMAAFVKDVLYPGEYSVPDGEGGRKKVRYTRQDVQHLAARMKEMLDAGLSIPLAAEHQERAKPLTKAERQAEWVKKLTMGWAESAELAPEGFLTTKVEVPVDDDAKRLPAARFVSPEIVNDFIDGDGRKWPGPSITHLAVTPRPVQHHQRPFQPVRMSVIRLSLADYQGEPMAEERDETGKGSESSDSKGSEFKLDDLRKLLADDGYGVPDHIKEPQDFLMHLHTAALSKRALIDKLVEDEEDEDDESMNAEGEEVEDNGLSPEPEPAAAPILMSLGGRQFSLQRVKSSKGKGMGKQGKQKLSRGDMTRLSLAESRAERAEKALLGERRQSLVERIRKLFSSGRITKPIRDQLTQQAGTVRLSLDDQGQLATNAVLAKVEAYEALPSGSSWSNEGALPPDVQPAPPQEGWGNESIGNVAQQVNDFFSMLPSGAARK